MIKRSFAAVILLFLLILVGSSASPFRPAAWVPLFNGKNLDNWVVKVSGYPLGENYGNVFRVGNGILSVRYDQYDSFQLHFGGLYYKQKFSNYRLKAEYRFVGETAKGAPVWGFRDSGIQYHCQSPGSIGLNQPFPVCLEYNLKGGNGKEERPVGEICLNGTYCTLHGARNPSFCNAPDVKKTFHGDEWVTLEIEVRGNLVKHFVNGQQILEFTDPRLDPKNELAGKLIVGGNDALRDGYISLQSNSHPIDFRKIEIQEY